MNELYKSYNRCTNSFIFTKKNCKLLVCNVDVHMLPLDVLKIQYSINSFLIQKKNNFRVFKTFKLLFYFEDYKIGSNTTCYCLI